MNRRLINSRVSACYVLLFVMLVTGGLSADTPLPKTYDLPSKQQVITFLTESIDWYRYLSVEQQIATDPVDLLFLDDNQPIGAQIVRLSFDFARADASLVATSLAARSDQGGAAIPDTSSSELAHFVDLEKKSEEASRQASQDVESLKRKLLTGRRADHQKLQAALDETQSRLELLQAGSKSLRDLVEFVRATGAGGPQTGNLAATIDDLARTVPEATNLASLPAELSMQNSKPSTVPKPRDPGILGLTSEISALERKLHILDEAMRLTDKLALSSQDLRTPLATFINQVVQSGEASNLQASDLGVLQQQKARLDALTLQIKDLSPAIEALDKQRVLLTVYKSHLGSWRTAVVSQYKKAWENLILRLVVLGVVIASLAGIAAVLRRVTVRHVHDANRRRMILVVQRIVIWFAIILAAAFAFASDLSSLATFLGLLTAGVAVALQNVILAVLGYFLLVGKRGIRVGDRVQISGVTGDVIDIGLLQFQLREVDMRNQQPTGHVATFSNSFVFVAPATGLFKFIPENSNASRPEVVKQISRV
jgi:Mechanosensitive ion channel